MRVVAPVIAVVVLLLAVAGCGATVSGTPAADPAVVSEIAATKQAATASAASSAAADRAVCVDLDARGGALYGVFVVPMMSGAAGKKSVNVDAAQMVRATATLADLGSGSLAEATGDVRDQGQRVVAAAESLGIYNNTEGTALLTAFVSLSVACTQAGNKPSWFDPAALASN